MNNIYVVLLSAKNNNNLVASSDIAYMFEISVDLAYERALRLCVKTFPYSDGYTNHKAKVLQIDNDDIAENYLRHL